MEEIYATDGQMERFYEWYKFRRGGTPGNGFTGNLFKFL